MLRRAGGDLRFAEGTSSSTAGFQRWRSLSGDSLDQTAMSHREEWFRPWRCKPATITNLVGLFPAEADLGFIWGFNGGQLVAAAVRYPQQQRKPAVSSGEAFWNRNEVDSRHRG